MHAGRIDWKQLRIGHAWLLLYLPFVAPVLVLAKAIMLLGLVVACNLLSLSDRWRILNARVCCLIGKVISFVVSVIC